MITLKTFPLFILTLIAYTAASQQITFEKYYDYGHAEAANSVQQTYDGGYILAGRQGIGIGIMDLMLIKTDSTGEVEWDYFYGTGNNENEAFDVVQTYDSGYVAVGYTTVLGMKANVLILKTDKEGNLMWAKNYGTPNSCRGSSIVQTYDSGFIVTGGWDGGKAFLLKTDQNGDSTWLRTYEEQGQDGSVGFSVIQTQDSGFAFTGTSFESVIGDVYVVRTDKHGNELWSQAEGGSENDRGQSIALTDDGGFIVTGYTWSYGAGRYDVYLIKLDQNGNVEWTKTFGDENANQAYSVIQTSDGGYILSGRTAWPTQDVSITSWLIKADYEGELEWEKTYTGINAEQIIQANDGGFAFCGLWEGDAYLIKTDGKGKIINSIIQHQHQKEQVKVYPNPFSQRAVVELKGDDYLNNTTLHLYSTSGREVLTRPVSSPQTTIYRNGLPAGIYILQVRRDREIIERIKVVIN